MAKLMKKTKSYTFIDLFAGAGGLSEGFIRAGYTPIAHIEMNKDACNTLKTRSAFHYLQKNGMLSIYEDYLRHKKEGTDGRKLWDQVPKSVINTTICATIGENTIDDIFKNVDELKGKRKVDIIIGGPPCQAYSVAGRARMGKEVENDPRNELYILSNITSASCSFNPAFAATAKRSSFVGSILSLIEVVRKPLMPSLGNKS